MFPRPLLLCLALALSACSGAPEQTEAGEETSRPSPILYEIASSDGAVEGWLFGTIHALPDGTRWRTETLDDAIDDADLLVVEIAGLEDQQAMFDAFMSLSRTEGQPDIAMRVAPANRPSLFGLIEKSGYRPHDFSSVETWAAALMLAQVNSSGEPENGVDRVLLRQFEGRDIREFEGALAQLGVFDRLAEDDQRDLLEGVLAENARDDPDRLRKAWIAGDESVLIEATHTGIMADPELREAILTGRNDAWMAQLVPMLALPEQPMVAVGTAHLVGPDGLAARLQEHGYLVKRIQ